jgi:hypothetical protein
MVRYISAMAFRDGNKAAQHELNMLSRMGRRVSAIHEVHDEIPQHR